MHGLTIAASVGVHAALTAVLSLLAYRTLAAPPPPQAAPAPSSTGTGMVSIELPVAGSEAFADEPIIDPIGDPPRITAGQDVARLDTGAAGRGGTASVREPALNLADTDERMRLSPDPIDRLDRDQLQRLRAARVRTSWEDRRATTHPAELTLVVNGTGTVFERRAESRTDPSRGALESPSPRVQGTAPGVAVEALEGEQGNAGPIVGSRATAPGLGLVDGRPGRDHRVSAPIARARPAVVFGPVAVPAPRTGSSKGRRRRPARGGHRHRIARTRQLRGRRRRRGHRWKLKGVASQAPAELGGRRLARDPSSAQVAQETSSTTGRADPRLVPYFRRIHAKIDPLWVDAFPRSALFDLKQGTVILDFTVYADGHAVVSWPPLRPSGIDEFDRHCADAIRRAAPFRRSPRTSGPSYTSARRSSRTTLSSSDCLRVQPIIGGPLPGAYGDRVAQ